MNEAQKRFADPSFKEAVVEEMCERLAEGRSLVSVCAETDMPSVRTVQNWMNDDAKLAAQITRAREAGFMILGDLAVEEALSADDAALGRLAFDARRWYLGKLSNAFREKPIPGGSKEEPLHLKVDVVKLTDAQLEALAALETGDAD